MKEQKACWKAKNAATFLLKIPLFFREFISQKNFR